MPRKASGEPKIKRVERRRANGDIYVYEVTTLYNPAIKEQICQNAQKSGNKS